MRPGVVGLLPSDPAAVTTEHARRLRELGFSGASIFIRDPDTFDPAALAHARTVLAGEGVRVAQANADYAALVHPEDAMRAEGVRLARRACRAARLLDAVYLYIRPGTMAGGGSAKGGGHWRPHPDNHLPATFDRLVDSLQQVCSAAEAEGILLGIEGHVTSPLNTAARVREVIEAVGSPTLRFNCDPVNFVGSFQEAYHTAAVSERLFTELGQYTISAHVKDLTVGDRLVVHIDECPVGEGLFDLVTFVRLFEQHCPDGYALIEHLPDEQIPAAKRALDVAVEQASITWRM